jgi:hypothetical protein
LTNQDRASAGLNALTNDSYLHKEAEWRAKDMADRNYFSHQIPPGNKMVFDDMQKDGYCFKVAGENIGLSTFGDDAATTSIEKAFMGSKGHRANILGTWQRMGVGAYKSADGRKLYAVLFSVRCSPKKPAAAKATTKPVVKATPKATPTVTPTQQPTVEPTATPAATAEPSPTAVPAAAPDTLDGLNPPGGTISLLVREKAQSRGPLDSLGSSGGFGLAFDPPWASIALAVLFGVLISFTAAIYPAGVASRQSIVRALQHE